MLVEPLRDTVLPALQPIREMLEAEEAAGHAVPGVALYVEGDSEPPMPLEEDYADPGEYGKALAAWDAAFWEAREANRLALAAALESHGLDPATALRGVGSWELCSLAMAAIDDDGVPRGLLLFFLALLLSHGAACPDDDAAARAAETAAAEALLARGDVPEVQAEAVARWLAGPREAYTSRSGAASGPETLRRVLLHEAGHLRFAAAVPGLPAEGCVVLGPDPLFDTAFGRSLAGLEPPSLYACRSPHEWFAEAYTLWRCGEADAGNAGMVEGVLGGAWAAS